MLKYYDLIYSLPFEVSQYKDQKEKTSSVILCTEKDLNHFQVLKYRFNKIPGLDKVYSVVNWKIIIHYIYPVFCLYPSFCFPGGLTLH